jgi:uncharacterized membrane protein YjjP (DUF1212 family)
VSLPFATPRASGYVTSTHELAIGPRLLIELATQLHTHGFAAHRIEAMLVAAAQQLQVEAQFFTTPTSLFVAFGDQETQRVHLIRVEPGETNLGMMAALDEIATGVATGRLDAATAMRRLMALPDEAPRYPAWMTVAAFSLVAVAVATLLDVGVVDLGVAAVAGLVTGVLAILSGRWTPLVPILEPASAFWVSLICLSAATITGSAHAYPTTLAGLVVLLPGLMLTTGLTELSTRHLASGTSRLSGALVVFIGMAFGIALGYKVAAWIALPGAFPLHNPPAPDWLAYLSPVLAAACFVVLLRADRRDAPIIIAAGLVAWWSARLGTRLLDDQLGGIVGAFAVTAGSNLAARWTRRSAMVTTVPGILLLVPGSIGFQSINALLGRDATEGVQAAFRLVLVGISLAAGLLLGSALVPPPRDAGPR